MAEASSNVPEMELIIKKSLKEIIQLNGICDKNKSHEQRSLGSSTITGHNLLMASRGKVNKVQCRQHMGQVM